MRHQPMGLFSIHDFVMLVHQHYLCSVSMLPYMQIISCSNSIMFFPYSFQHIMKTQLHTMLIKTFLKTPFHNHISKHIKHHQSISQHYLKVLKISPSIYSSKITSARHYQIILLSWA
jgi:hypothetical protein